MRGLLYNVDAYRMMNLMEMLTKEPKQYLDAAALLPLNIHTLDDLTGHQGNEVLSDE